MMLIRSARGFRSFYFVYNLFLPVSEYFTIVNQKDYTPRHSYNAAAHLNQLAILPRKDTCISAIYELVLNVPDAPGNSGAAHAWKGNPFRC